MQSQLSKNIYQTVVYYDILNFPLTTFELWKNLIAEKEYALSEIVEALENNELKERVEEFRGYHFLKGCKDLVARRIQNDKNSGVKFEIAERVARWLRYVPFVRMAAVTGTLAMKNCEKNSDIDFFVVLEKGRIFTGRLLTTALVHLLGRRRYGNKIKNRICLNYFIATDNLEIERKDLFAANEYSFIYPIFDCYVIPAKAGIQGFTNSDFYTGSRVKPGMTKKSVFGQFCEVNFGWIRKFKSNWEISELKPARYFVEHSRISRAAQRFFESLINLFFGDRIEAWLKRKQIARIEKNPLTQKPGAYIVANDRNLIFLPEPQGMRIEEEWQRRIEITKKS